MRLRGVRLVEVYCERHGCCKMLHVAGGIRQLIREVKSRGWARWGREFYCPDCAWEVEVNLEVKSEVHNAVGSDSEIPVQEAAGVARIAGAGRHGDWLFENVPLVAERR